MNSDDTTQDARRAAKEQISKGISALQMQDPDRAQRHFRAALTLQHNHPDACHLLAVTLMQAGKDLDEAESLIRVALAEKPDEPVYYNSLGTVLWQKGDIAGAGTYFNKAISLRPGYVDALYNSGNAYRELKEYDKAVVAYQNAIGVEPTYIRAYNDLGLVYQFMERFQDAIEQFMTALELDPVWSDVYLNLANAYQSLGEFDDARMAVQNSLAIDPDNSKAYNNLGTISYQQEDYEEAEEALRQALALDPDSAQAVYNLGLVLHELEEFDQAIEMFDKALAHIQEWPSALVNKANALYRLCRFPEAIEAYEKAIQLAPGYAAAHLNLASTYRRMCVLDKAVECFDRAIALRPDNAAAHFGKSLVLLKAGDMRAGWRHYEWRFEVSGNHFNPHPDLHHPEWKGQPIEDKTLMVIGEQGLGDIIHFVRYMRLLKGKCRKIVFSCSPSLIPLLSGMKEIDEFVDRTQPWHVTCDYYIHLLSLPRVFNTSVETIPGDVPYVFAEPGKTKSWRRRMQKDQFNVGLVWSGNPDQAENDHRSCPLQELELLGDVTGVCYYSLQKGAGADQLKSPGVSLDIIDHTEELEDFSDTAALVQALDLVITIDTSVAHLAGALNAPVWTMLWFAHCWRYLHGRTDTPWYPSMRLFHQPAIGDWSSVVAEVRSALSELVEARARTAGAH